jgi:protein-tyrosine phosphatase
MADPGGLRHVSPLAGAFNFRDLGGLRAGPLRRVRDGVLFRSDTLQALTDDDVTRLVDRLGVELLVDLRLGPETVSQGADRWPPPKSATSTLRCPRCR